MTILLTTLNARFAHASLGLRYLFANLKEYQAQSEIVELTIQQDLDEMLALLATKKPTIIGFGVYIWNINEITRLVRDLKVLMPDTIIILGGPEISYEYEETPLFDACDHLITGWGDISFYELCRDLSNGIKPPKVIQGIQPKLAEITLPYQYYSDHDLKHRTIYLEASRGCPFKCEFCLSSLDKTAWSFPLDCFLEEIDQLYTRGLRQFKFVDRTFNLKREFTTRILTYFLDKLATFPDEEIFLHFELVPDFLSDELKALILCFPNGCLQFEIGIQTLNPKTQKLISRKTNLIAAKENISWLSNHTDVHLHVDLIAGLPAEDLTLFAKGFNELWSWNPQEIQLGILKRLKGTPIARHTAEFDYRYSLEAPYTILANKDMDFETINQMKRVAKFWDLLANSGRFNSTLAVILGEDAFQSFWDISNWLYAQLNRAHSIALDRLFALVFEYLTTIKNHPLNDVQEIMGQDFMRIGLQGWPRYLGDKPEGFENRFENKNKGAQPKRQQLHS